MTNMNNSIFRQKSMDRVSSPEQLNDYIKVTNPGIWVVLAAVIVLLLGFIVWGAAGTLETRVNVAAVSDGGSTVLYVSEADITNVAQDNTVRIGDKEYNVTAIADEPVAVDNSFTAYTLHIGSLSVGEWVYPVTVSAELPNGVYEAVIITDSVSPISFLFN